MKRILMLLTLMLFNFIAFAGEEPVEMADAMRENGKIYVVVAVLVVIMTGIFIYLISIDRKLTKLEKEIKK